MSQINIAPIIDCWNIFLSEPRQKNTVFSRPLTNACMDKQNNRKFEKRYCNNAVVQTGQLSSNA